MPFESLEHPHLAGHVDLDALAGGEGDLVLGGKVSWVHQGEVEPAAFDPEGDGTQAAGELVGDQAQDFLGDAAQVVDLHRGDAQLLGEAFQQQIFTQGVHLEQAGAEPAAGHVLVLQGACQLLDRDPAARHEELSELRHASK